MENNEQITPTQIGNDLKVTTEERLKDLADKLKNALPSIIATLIAIWWIFYGMIEISSLELSLVDRIGLTLITIVFGYTYRSLIANGGYTSAKQSAQWKSVTRDWNDAIRKGNGIKEEIKMYAKDIAKDNQKMIRKENLENNELRYQDYFNEDGELIGVTYKAHKDLTKHQKKIISKCVNLKIHIPTLFGNISNKFFGIKKEEELKSHQFWENIKSLLTTIVLAIATAGITFRWLGITLEAFIYAFFQITLWSATALVSRINNYNYVIEKIAPQIVEKTLLINGYMALDETTKNRYKTLVNEMRGIKEIKKEEDNKKELLNNGNN